MGESNRKKGSVAAFLFMPQFRLSFQGLFQHIIPAFMRTLAIMFVQAGLVPGNHPATRYGMEGVKRYGLFSLIGEAWFTLRTTRATPYQWGMFGSVLMMLGIIFAWLAMTILTAGFGLGRAAHAQLFSISAGDTTADTITPWAGAGMFDTAVPALGSGGHADFAIMVLDKMLRQGMSGAGVGAPLQVGMQSLMQVYNSGVLVVAGIMLFWAVLAVVVDTAKTGVVGGGRHNMVWAPIRIVFALGLLIPLGDVGFSSGQFMVVKIAEWGSNLATNAWKAYMGRVAVESLVANMITANPTELIRAYSDIWLCRVAYNSYQFQTLGDLPADQEVVRKVTEGGNNHGAWAVRFTNETTGNLCGMLTFPHVLGDQAYRAAAMPGGPGGNIFAAQGITPLGTDPIADGIVAFKYQMMRAYGGLFYRDTGGGDEPGAMDQVLLSWACDFAGQHIMAGAGGSGNPLVDSGMCETALGGKDGALTSLNLGACGGDINGADTNGDGTTPSYPNDRCIMQAMDIFSTRVQEAMNRETAALSAILATSLEDNTMLDRGWADMGQWFLRIGRANEAVKSMSISPVTVAPGELTKDAPTSRGGALWSGFRYAQPDIDQKMTEVHSAANYWWKHEAVTAASRPNASTDLSSAANSLQMLSNKEIQGPGFLDIIASVAMLSNPVTGPLALLNFVASFLPISGPQWILEVIQPSEEGIYPFAHLILIGNLIFDAGLILVALPSLLALLIALVTPTLEIVSALVEGPIGHVMTTVGGTMVLAGAVMKFYLPLIPFLRVAFAVLTWMISVFEAVAMVPIAALAHISTEGEGLAGQARQAWILWLNVLLRPVLTVIGYVGAIMVFNTFVIYLHEAMKGAVVDAFGNGLGFAGLVNSVVTTVIYVGTVYVVANSTFKMLDLIPNALMRWMGGSPDHSFDDNAMISGMMSYAGNQVAALSRGMDMSGVRKAMQGNQKQGGAGAGGGKTGGGGPGGGGGGGAP